MENERHIGIVIRCLNHRIGRAVSAAAAKEFGDSATGVHGWVIAYLYDNRDRDVFQKDLESRFSVRRSTMTSILKLMEKKGLIVKEPVDHDARLKKLILTPEAMKIQERMKLQIEEIETRMRSCLTDEEYETFFGTVEKLSASLS